MLPKKLVSLFGVVVVFAFGFINPSYALEELTAAIHVHSNVSKGALSPEEIAKKARMRGVDVVVLSDSLKEEYKYGPKYINFILQKKVDRNSIMKFGVEEYLREIRKARRSYPEILMFPGYSVTPFYYWSGDRGKNTLTLNSRAKDLLVFGLNLPEDFKVLPIIGRKNFPFDAYHGNQHDKPYQYFIDDVNRKTGFSYWSHPQAEEHHKVQVSKKKSVYLETNSYEESLLSTKGYTGFGVDGVELHQIDRSPKKPSSVGGEWDQVLREYLGGVRNKPVWVLGELDFTGHPKSSVKLNSLINRIRVKERSVGAAQEAITKGALYVVQPNPIRRRSHLLLNEFLVRSQGSEAVARMGETLQVRGKPSISISMGFSDDYSGPAQIQLIRNGTFMKEWTETLPFQKEIIDEDLSVQKTSYYRLIVLTDEGDRLLSNPIFVEPI